MDWVVTILIILPAVYLWIRQSSWLIDYLVWITVLNRGIRRYVDWLNGAFNPLSPVSLTPLAISGLVFLMVLQNYAEFPPYIKRIFKFFAVALAIGFVVGLVRNQLAAVYALAEYVAPFSIMGCAVIAGGNEKILDRWVKSVGWAAVFVSTYGWYQYYTIPAWDAFWVRAVNFEGYLGSLRPTEMTVFSTMSERGPLASFLAFAVIPMLVSKRWRNFTGWLSIVLIVSTILLTLVRSALITIALATILFPILNGGKNSFRIVILLCVAALGANFVLNRLPSSERVKNRLETIQNLAEDGSFKGRVVIAQDGAGAVLGNPIGTGLGSTGLGGRVNTGGLDANAAIGDNGYLDIFYVFGWVGAGCFFYGLYLLWNRSRFFEKKGIRDEAAMMFKALFVTGSISLVVGNWLVSTGAVIFFIFAGFAIYPKQALLRQRRQKELLERKRSERIKAEGLPAT